MSIEDADDEWHERNQRHQRNVLLTDDWIAYWNSNIGGVFLCIKRVSTRMRQPAHVKTLKEIVFGSQVVSNSGSKRDTTRVEISVLKTSPDRKMALIREKGSLKETWCKIGYGGDLDGGSVDDVWTSYSFYDKLEALR